LADSQSKTRELRNWSKDDMLLGTRADAAKLALHALEHSYLISDFHTYVENILQTGYIVSVHPVDCVSSFFLANQR
jgi:hypothetical protein